MCGGVYYRFNDQEVRTYFPNPNAKLPVLTRSGGAILIPWGRRKEQEGRLPKGGWARLESIHEGRWDPWFPRSVKLPIASFMEKDIEARSHWFDLTKGQWIQGLIATIGAEQRVYVVTIVPTMVDAVHERWPRIMSG